MNFARIVCSGALTPGGLADEVVVPSALTPGPSPAVRERVAAQAAG